MFGKEKQKTVKADQEKSSFLNKRMGIPKGSNLGPYYFSVFFTNNLTKTCPRASLKLYADDAATFF